MCTALMEARLRGVILQALLDKFSFWHYTFTVELIIICPVPIVTMEVCTALQGISICVAAKIVSIFIKKSSLRFNIDNVSL
jgi:hypothetical protein